MMVVAVSFERYCGVPMIRNSVLEGFTERRFEVSHAWTESRVEDRVVRLVAESELLKEM